MKLTISGIYILLLLLFSACHFNHGDGPEDPVWGKQSCSHCGMILSEKRYAAQRVISAGKRYFYDDLNCAIEHSLREDEKKSLLYVRPDNQEQWFEATKVRYKGKLMTPMNSGYGAVLDQGEYTFEEVQKNILKK